MAKYHDGDIILPKRGRSSIVGTDYSRVGLRAEAVSLARSAETTLVPRKRGELYEQAAFKMNLSIPDAVGTLDVLRLADPQLALGPTIVARKNVVTYYTEALRAYTDSGDAAAVERIHARLQAATNAQILAQRELETSQSLAGILRGGHEKLVNPSPLLQLEDGRIRHGTLDNLINIRRPHE